MSEILQGRRVYREPGQQARHGDFVEIDNVPVGIVNAVFPTEFEVLGVCAQTYIGHIPVEVKSMWVSHDAAAVGGVKFYYYERG